MSHRRIYKSVSITPLDDSMIVTIMRDFRWGKGSESRPYKIMHSYRITDLKRLNRILNAKIAIAPEIKGAKSAYVQIC